MYIEDPSNLYSEAQRIEILRQQMVAQLKIKLPATHAEENDALGVRIFRSDGPTAKTPGIYEPIVCFLLQGEKQISVGSQMIRYQPMQYLLVPVTLPASGRVIKASSDQPYLGMAFNIDIKTLSDLVIELGDKLPVGADPARGINIGDMDYSMVSAFYRLLTLMDEPNDIPIMLPLIKREILYRLLMSDVGSQLRDFALLDSQTHRIVKVIDQLRQRFNEPLRIKELAELVHMSESALYQGFKAVTSMTPLQFQKQLRLNEARRIMLYDGIEASTASYKVGYESPSQFSREYSRLFGAPPKTDISRFRQSL